MNDNDYGLNGVKRLLKERREDRKRGLYEISIPNVLEAYWCCGLPRGGFVERRNTERVFNHITQYLMIRLPLAPRPKRVHISFKLAAPPDHSIEEINRDRNTLCFPPWHKRGGATNRNIARADPCRNVHDM